MNCVQFLPDGSCVASGSADRTIKMWDIRSRQLIQVRDGFFYFVSSFNLSILAFLLNLFFRPLFLYFCSYFLYPLSILSLSIYPLSIQPDLLISLLIILAILFLCAFYWQHYGAHTDGVTSISMHNVRTFDVLTGLVIWKKLFFSCALTSQYWFSVA